MTMMVLNRTYVLVSKSGHAIGFEKDKPINVPPSVYHEAVAIGAVNANGDSPDVLPPEVKKVEVVDPIARTKALEAAFDLLLERDQRGDFTGAGAPTKEAVMRITDFRVEGTELKAVWQAYREKLSLKKEEAELAARKA